MNWKIISPEELEVAIFRFKYDLCRQIGVRSGMRIVDVGCGQGGFTAALSKVVGECGNVIGVDVSDEYVSEFWRNVEKWGVKSVVTWVQGDAVALRSVLPDCDPDVVASYRLLEELKNCTDMPRVIGEMAKVAKRKGAIRLMEMSTQVRNGAESNYVRLHMESGDCFFERELILEVMKHAGLSDVCAETVDTDVWFSPRVAKQDLEFAQLWYDKKVEKRLGPLIDKFGMKYPVFLLYSGVKK
jgi:sterol 24-C-methyltransferase